MCSFYCFFFKQKTAYEMRISDWSSDVCSSDLDVGAAAGQHLGRCDVRAARLDLDVQVLVVVEALVLGDVVAGELRLGDPFQLQRDRVGGNRLAGRERHRPGDRKSTRLNSSH